MTSGEIRAVTPRAELPKVEAILPHAGSSVLLSRVLEHRPTDTVCCVELREPTLFSEPDGGVPAWVGVEYMAQCIAAHAGLLELSNGARPRAGYLIGSREIVLHTARFDPEQVLEVSARHVWGGREGMVSFDCSVIDATTRELLVEARLNCFLPPEEK